MMIFNKYQLISEISQRGYSMTALGKNEKEESFFIKWIRGIEEKSSMSKTFSNKLRHLQRIEHSCLPKIIEYGWEDTQKAYCVVFQYIEETENLENIRENIYSIDFLVGIKQVVDCLQKLHSESNISHGDITPANILVDAENNFYLIDFGVSDVASTLSQESSLEIFAKQFAAPEKWNPTIPKGFPYQSDVYSIGKVIGWFFEDTNMPLIDELVKEICKENPSERLGFRDLSSKLQGIIKNPFFDVKYNLIGVWSKLDISSFLEEMNNPDFSPKFDISPKKGDNILLNIATENFYAEALWLFQDNILNILRYYTKEENNQIYENTLKRGVGLKVPIRFFYYNTGYYIKRYSLTQYFQKILQEKQEENTYRADRKNIYKELDFYKELVEKELDVITKNSLRLSYTNFKKISDTEIWFQLADNEKYSSDGFIYTHIDNSLPPNGEEFEYILSSTADKKQIKKGNPKFSGVAYDFENKKSEESKDENEETELKGCILKFKDCENLNFETIPRSGFIFQDVRQKEEDKKRQLEAINKVKNNDVQNRELIHYLFNADKLQGEYLDPSLENIYQTDDKGSPFKYSYNQKQAIFNALERKPLSVIQGPPGTGKTTVITEIVFQILNRDAGAKILITSQTNDAVDNVLENLLAKNIPLVRLSGVKKPKQILKKHTLERKIEGWKEQVKKRTEENWKPIKEQFRKELEKTKPNLISVFELLSENKSWDKKKSVLEKVFSKDDLQNHLESESVFIKALKNKTGIDFESYFEKQQIYKDWLDAVSGLDEKGMINQKLIDSIRVIGATTSHIAAKKYSKFSFEFDYVIMDESGKATLSESLIPLVLGNNAVLVGDHRQLRPMLTSDKEVEKWLREKYKKESSIDEFDNFEDYFNRPSLFEKIIETINEDYKSQLIECRRMPKDAVTLTSKCFYEPFGDEKIDFVQRSEEKEHNLDLKVDNSLIFLDIGNECKSETDGTGSSKNKKSATIIPQILLELDKFDIVENYSVGVITGYKAQLREIKKQLKPLHSKKMKHIQMNNLVVSVVDKFQGLEKDIIIFDLVRSNQNTLGFLANANRINVALSRHKKLLIIVGNYQWLSQVKSSKKEVALQKYLLSLKKEWIVKDIKHLF